MSHSSEVDAACKRQVDLDRLEREATFRQKWSQLSQAELVGHLARLSYRLSEGARLHRDCLEDRHLGFLTQITAVIDFFRETRIQPATDLEPLEHGHSEGLDESTGSRLPGGLRKPLDRQGAYASSDAGMVKIYVWAASETLITQGLRPSEAFCQIVRDAREVVEALRSKGGATDLVKRLKVVRDKINSAKSHKDFPANGKEACFISMFRGELSKANKLPDAERWAHCAHWYNHLISEAKRHLHRIR